MFGQILQKPNKKAQLSLGNTRYSSSCCSMGLLTFKAIKGR